MILLSFKFLTWYAAMGLLCPSSLPMREPHHRKCAWITYMFMTAYILQSNLQGYDLKLSATNYWSSDKLPTSLRFIMVCGCFICLVLSVFFFFFGICSIWHLFLKVQQESPFLYDLWLIFLCSQLVHLFQPSASILIQLTTLRSCILLDSSFSVSPLLGCDW